MSDWTRCLFLNEILLFPCYISSSSFLLYHHFSFHRHSFLRKRKATASHSLQYQKHTQLQTPILIRLYQTINSQDVHLQHPRRCLAGFYRPGQDRSFRLHFHRRLFASWSISRILRARHWRDLCLPRLRRWKSATQDHCSWLPTVLRHLDILSIVPPWLWQCHCISNFQRRVEEQRGRHH